MSIPLYRIVSAFFLFLLVGCTGGEFLSPGSIVVDRNSKKLYTALTTAHKIAVTSLPEGTTNFICLDFNPNNLLLSSDGTKLYVSYGQADGGVAVVDTKDGSVITTVPLGHTPTEMQLSTDESKLYVCVRHLSSVAVVNVLSCRLLQMIQVGREPYCLAQTEDGRGVVVGCFLPDSPATDSIVAARVVLIDTRKDSIRWSIPLPSGAHSVRDVVLDGDFAYVSHILSRFYVPVTQLDRGWVNSNAVSVIDVVHGKLTATVLMDDVDFGAANLSGMYTGEETLYLLCCGGNELIRLDLKKLHEKLEQSGCEDVSSDLSFAAEMKQRIPLQGVSPQCIASDGNKLYISSRFSPGLDVVDPKTLMVTGAIVLGKEPSPTTERLGEYYFFTSDICYQKWQSCASCHPDARVDGVNWDLPNDGLGNPKNTKSMLYSHKTPPCMITGIRADAETAVRKGILHTMGTTQPEAVATAIDAYLSSLEAVASPFLENGKLSAAAFRGKTLYETCGCAQCHNGTYLTDGKPYFVGVADSESEPIRFDTPSLREVWRTAPYLYDGRAVTVKEVLTTYNPTDLHGTTSKLSDAELNDLAEYVLSL